MVQVQNIIQIQQERSRIKERHKHQTRNKSKKTSNSFEFTSYWADSNNKVISDLVDFTRTFFAKHTSLNILTKYCVFTSEDLLLVMRPYQIVATKRILNRIQVATNYKKMGTNEAGLYLAYYWIWKNSFLIQNCTISK